MVKIVECWNRLPGEVIDSPVVEVFKNKSDKRGSRMYAADPALE